MDLFLTQKKKGNNMLLTITIIVKEIALVQICEAMNMDCSSFIFRSKPREFLQNLDKLAKYGVDG